MKKKVIGILGHRGLVGKDAENILRKTDKYQLRLGSRLSNEEINPSYKNEDISYHQVDVYNHYQLERFTDPCDLVINCTGPSSKILSTVAEVCIDKNIIYLNPSGDKEMVKKIVEYQEKKQVSSPCVFSAGIYPGLTEIFLDYISSNFFEKIFTVKVFFSGIGSFSRNGAYDIISSIENDEGVGMAFCKNGRIEKINGGFGERILLPEPIGQVNTIPLVSDEFLKVARQHQLHEAYFYNTFTNSNLLTEFMMIKASGQYRTEDQKYASAEKLINAYNKNRNQNDCFILHAVSTGQKEGRSIELQSTLICHKDWNKLSGTVAGIVADEILCEKQMKRGSYFAHEVATSKQVFERFLQQENIVFHNEKALPF